MGGKSFGGATQVAAVQGGSAGLDVEGPASQCLFFMGMPKEVTSEQAKAVISQYGQVKSCQALGSATGAMDSTLLVEMATVQEAKWLRDNLDGNIPQGLTDGVTIRYVNVQGLAAEAQGAGPMMAASASNRYSPYGASAGAGDAGAATALAAFAAATSPGAGMPQDLLNQAAMQLAAGQPAVTTPNLAGWV